MKRYLLSVTGQLPVRIGSQVRPDVALKNDAVTTSGRNLISIPGKRPNPGRVAVEHGGPGLRSDVPDLDTPLSSADGKQISLKREFKSFF